MVRSKKIKKSNNSIKVPVLRRGIMTKLQFTMAVLWGTASALIFTLIFIVYAAIIYIDHVKKLEIVRTFYQNNSTLGQVIYRNDKVLYRPDEMINLDIVNNSNESIYLAPCQYFNEFEKKISDKWQTVSLAACSEIESVVDSASIEKISRKAEDFVLANKLGEGVWRGVSVVYYGCQKAQVKSCKNNQKIYTNEFMINDPKVASNSEPQL